MYDNRSKKPIRSSEKKYDDALPTSLKGKDDILDIQKTLEINKKSDIELSPYVIHLGSNTSNEETIESKIEALANSLITDPDLLFDDIDQNLDDKDDGLSINFNELSEQLRHDVSVATCTTETLQQNSLQKTVEENRLSSEGLSSHVPESFTITEVDFTPTITIDELSLLLEELRRELNIEACTQKENNIDVIDILDNDNKEEQYIFQVPSNENSLDDSYTTITIVNEDLPLLEPTSEPKKSLLSLVFSSTKVRAIGTFVLLSFILVLPLHALERYGGLENQQTEITDVGRQAIDHFMRGASALESDRFDVAETDFAKASQDFADAESSLKDLNSSLAGLISVLPQTDKTYSSVLNLIDAGSSLSESANIMAKAGNNISSGDEITLVEKLRVLQTYVDQAIPYINDASDALEGVDPNVLPEEYVDVVKKMQLTTPTIADSMQEFTTFADTIAMILGEKHKMRYLVTFQNNTELRATGGFVGSFAEMDLLDGNIEQVYIPNGGTYDVQGQLDTCVKAPDPLTLLSARWELHDANWFPDFAHSAEKFLWFYKKTGGPTVDGVIAINATLMPDLLNILGPIEMPEYGKTIDAENFLFETQKIVEVEYEEYQKNDENRIEDAPKQFIGDLAPIILERIKEANINQLIAIADLLGSSLVEKDVQLYFENTSLQSHMNQLGWSGTLKETSGDYLMVVNTNLGGGKTDTVIDQQVDVDVKIDEDGSIVNTVTIQKEHRGLQSSLFEGENNVDYIRLYVPQGSELISASGFEIPSDDLFKTSELPLKADDDLMLTMTNEKIDADSKTDIWDEHGKTVFGNWMQTKPGEIETVTFSYKLPFTLDIAKKEESLIDIAKYKLGFKNLETYTLLLQKQSGVNTRMTSVSIETPEQSSIIWGSHDGTSAGIDVVVPNTTDEFLRFVLEQDTE